MLLHPQATSTNQGGPRTSDLSIEGRRRNHFTTASPNFSIFRALPKHCFVPSLKKLAKKGVDQKISFFFRRALHPQN